MMHASRRFLFRSVLGLIGAGLPGCFGSGAGGAAAETGQFVVEGINVADGQVWPLNQSLRLRFNHAVDPTSIHFGSIILRGLDAEAAGRPVIGSFEIVAGTGGRHVLFRPACPTNSENTDGAFLPGGHPYELVLPTALRPGLSVLRDLAGRPLSYGLHRRFKTPTPPAEPMFLDTVAGPPVLVETHFPPGLNLYSDPDPTIAIRFNQAIDGRDANLHPARLFVAYSDGEIGTPGEDLYCGLESPALSCTNRVPGRLFLTANCGVSGALVFFQVTGILPPNRNLRVVVSDQFRDIAGETGTRLQVSQAGATPTLEAYYSRMGQPDPDLDESQPTVDEYRDDFDTDQLVDLSGALQLPPASVGDGLARASFDFPGTAPPGADFVLEDMVHLEVNTSWETVLSDSNNQSFSVIGGVLHVNDFTIAAGSSLRALGSNPLVIYAAGTVTIDGTLDCSGFDSRQPRGLNTPGFPEPGAPGVCGGGDGGTASIQTGAETLRGEPGFGAFGVRNGGGGGGEGGFQQADRVVDGNVGTKYLLTAGGGGGTYALTPNQAIVWDRWSGTENPSEWDNEGPDHYEEDHDLYDDVKTLPTGRVIQGDPRNPIRGGEPGLRGTCYASDETDPELPHGIHGMEDQNQDTDALDFADDWNVPTTGFWAVPPGSPPGTPPQPTNFSHGHPTNGPDPGGPGSSVFSDDDTRNDFWGRRANNDGTVTVGELLAPWAGSGGGASGDCYSVRRSDLDGNGRIDEDPSLFFPVTPFPVGGGKYRKGAAGGGGGGQMLILAVGQVRLGPDARLLCTGGVGHAGEAVGFGDNHVSGSGGGSGGHLVISTATGLDLSRVELGQLDEAADVEALLEDRAAHPINLRAFGGRRGWAAPRLSTVYGSGRRDGNGDFMVGRGGAGGNGVIQLHVPDPASDIIWSSGAAPGIRDFITHGGGPPDVDRVEEVLGTVSAPQPYVLIPFFGSGSQFQSHWIDTGLAHLRDPLGGPWPDYEHELLRFAGTNPEGFVPAVSDRVVDLDPVLIAAPSSTIAIHDFEAEIPGASALFEAATDPARAQFLRNPELLVGYELLPSSDAVSGYQIVEARYSRASDVLGIVTRVADGSMFFGIDPDNPEWSIRRRMFGVTTSGQSNRLPSTAAVRIQFQGAPESEPGSNEPDPSAITPVPPQWTADLSQLKGLRFIRYRVTFEIDALDEGVSPLSERPALDFVKLPFAW